ncbi:MAG: hypothetical protein IPK58_08505 [Acidobacteria bacterium]|nr:hypothetical protein [Acidobacteriota bacterium]
MKATGRTGAVLSETDQTGRKLKTFVPANGTTLAEQELVTIGSTTTEKLTFIHQDPSLASLQRTDNAGNLVNSNARGRVRRLGRNVADAGPYNEPDDYPHFNYKVKPTEAQKLKHRITIAIVFRTIAISRQIL